ncbi:MAG: saccharopine dehydrogenase C-terminal domain-containing protein [Candidatus Eisenbacteria bacterium]
MKIVVLGGGQQGRVIAADLAAARPDARVVVADLHAPALPVLANLSAVEADLSSAEAVARLLHGADLGVGALPSRFGYAAMQGAIAAKRPFVDVSFSAENPLTLDAEARAAGVTIVPDAGLAPGLSHLCCGHAASRGALDELEISVGGVAQDPTRPYGYVVTWSVEDLHEEYVRDARIMRDGRPLAVPVFSDLKRVTVDGAGELESFLSDGLRTLLDTMPEVPNMAERTLRWPGHVEQVKPLVASGRFVTEIRARCTAKPELDLVAMVVLARWKDGRAARMTLVDRYDAATGLTAMARTTALTTSVTAQVLARGAVREPGVHMLERLGRDRAVYDAIVAGLAERGVRLRWLDEGARA